MDEKIKNLNCISCTIKGEFRNHNGEKPFIMYFRENEFILHEADTEYNVHITVRNSIKEITINANKEAKFLDVYSIALNILRLDSLFEGRFYPLISCVIDGEEYADIIKRATLPYFCSVTDYFLLDLNLDNQQYYTLYSNWISYFDKEINLNQLFLYAAHTAGLTSDLRMALMLQVFEPLESKLKHEKKIQHKLMERTNPYRCPKCGYVDNRITLSDRLYTLIDYYGQTIFNGENVEKIIGYAVETRNMIDHAKDRTSVEKKIFTGGGCGFYLKKFALLYCYITLLELGLNSQQLDAAIYSGIEEFNKKFPDHRITN